MHAWSFFGGGKRGRGVKVTSHLHIMPNSRMPGVIPPLTILHALISNIYLQLKAKRSEPCDEISAENEGIILENTRMYLTTYHSCFRMR
jgi:hypothetical protein